ncbi:LysM peptidoglycan-binding domain-containing protein [Paenibacillus campi]|uniref:LysM peptidoglycan-binding domain-containing protein n=1 Tax=Paenibacillus campi TaxID=3106031 RepID=UPI002AFE37DC|nr:LysM peptidoglycan-binding domain-containing protein [Paenibacillus sp. SGZ-1009]
MNQKIQKVLLSTALVAGFGAVAVSAPFSANHAFAQSEQKSNHEKNKEKADRLADNAAFLAAQEAQFQALFGKPATKEEAAAPKETTANEQTQANKQITVVVPQGASLTELAAQYGVTVDELVAANNLLPVGFQLTVPQK